MKFDELGRELPDNTPLEIPSGMKRPESLESMMARMLRAHLEQNAEAERSLEEQFEDEMDYEIEDDDAEIRATKYEEMIDEAPVKKEATSTKRSGRGSGLERAGEGSTEKRGVSREVQDDEEELGVGRDVDERRRSGRSRDSRDRRGEDRQRIASDRRRRDSRQADVEDDSEDVED